MILKVKKGSLRKDRKDLIKWTCTSWKKPWKYQVIYLLLQLTATINFKEKSCNCERWKSSSSRHRWAAYQLGSWSLVYPAVRWGNHWCDHPSLSSRHPRENEVTVWVITFVDHPYTKYIKSHSQVNSALATESITLILTLKVKVRGSLKF